MANKWTLINPKDSSTFPPVGQPILMRTTSSEKPPADSSYQSGFYDPTFMPPQALFDSTLQPLSRIDEGPVNWILISDLEKDIPKS